MAATHLHVGDRIRLTNHYLTYPAGTQGTITHLYRFSPSTCRVRFDGQAADEIVFRDAFTVVPPKPTAT